MAEKRRILGLGLLLFLILTPFTTWAASKETGGFTEVVLKNGITLKYKIFKDEPLASMYAVVPIGMNQEKAKGIAHLMEHLVFRGGAGYDFSDILDITAREGGFFSGFTTFYTTVYNYVVPKENFMNAFKIFNSSLWETNLSAEMVALEQKIVLHELDMGYTDRLTFYPVVEYFNPDTAYTRETVEAITVKDLQEFHQDFYQPENVTYVMAGDFDPEMVIAQLEQVANGFGKREVPKESLMEFSLPSGDLVEERFIYPYHNQLLMGYELEGLSEADRMVINLLVYANGFISRMDYRKNQYKFYYTLSRTLGNKEFFGIYYLERNQGFNSEDLIKEKERMVGFFRQFKKVDFKALLTNYIELIELEQMSASGSPVAAVEYEVQRLSGPDYITVDDLPVLKKLTPKDLDRVMSRYFSGPPKTWILINNTEAGGE